MKTIFYILFFACVFLFDSCYAQNNKKIKTTTTFDLTGNWSWATKNSTFDLTLNQSNNCVTGNYCAVANNGNKIDCYVNKNDSCSLYGCLSNNKANLVFTSCYVGAKGLANIIYNRHYIS